MPIRKNVLGPTLAVIFLGALIYIYHFEKKYTSEKHRNNRVKIPNNEIEDTLFKRPHTGEIEF